MSKFKINRDLIIQKLDNKISIFNGKLSLLFSLNSSASFIFEKLKTGWTDRKIITELVQKYNVSLQTAQKDFNTLLKDLYSKKILIQKK